MTSWLMSQLVTLKDRAPTEAARFLKYSIWPEFPAVLEVVKTMRRAWLGEPWRSLFLFFYPPYGIRFFNPYHSNGT